MQMFTQILHVYWFFLIARIAWNKVVHDKEVDDEREEEDALQLANKAADKRSADKGGKAH